MDKVSHIEKAVIWAKKQGFDQIKANFNEYEPPTQYTLKGESQTFTPDVTGIQGGRKNYVEIATKTNDVASTISKWKLLSTLAEMKGGTLYLLAPKGHKAFVEKMVKEHRLNAEVILLNK